MKAVPLPRSDVPEVMGTSEVADCLGVLTTNLQYIKDLPAPFQEVKATRLWLAAEIEAFAKIYRQRNGKSVEAA